MQTIRFACIVGARPNFMKMAPILRALEAYEHVEVTLIHSGQHYDAQLSDVFFEELEMRRPDVNLGVGSGKQGEQTARILEGLERVFENGRAETRHFDRVVVVGDVNSTMAAALAATKLQIPVAHVEAGLRSFDRSMPEEINRIVTDAVSDLLLVSEPSGVENLLKEGHPEGHVHLIGNVMIDTLQTFLPKARERRMLEQLGLRPGQYGVVTLHRPANVDDPDVLAALIDVLARTSEKIPLVFPIHPRTKRRLDEFGLESRVQAAGGLTLAPPLGYLDFLSLTSQSKLVVTDSGGLQEETTVLGIPCLTLRPNTERPVTVTKGTSTLVGNDPVKLAEGLESVLAGNYRRGGIPDLWDGQAALRIAKALVEVH